MSAAHRDAALAGLRQSYERVRMFTGTAEFGLMALALVFLRAACPEYWEDRHRDKEGVGSLAGQLRSVSRELDLAERFLPDVPGTSYAEILKAVELAARRLGNVEVFQLVLEEFACRDEILTPRSIAAVMTGTVDIAAGATVHDPFCRSGELLVAAARGEGTSGLGSTPDPRLATIATMNIRLHEVEGHIRHTETGDLPPAGSPKTSRIVVNPPFNADYPGRGDDNRWRYGPPPKGNANFAWLQHAAERLEPGGRAAVLMPNGAASSASPRERTIREGMVTDGCVEALIELPPSLFRATGVPATIWLLEPPGTPRDEVLFIDASKAGHMASRKLRELDAPEIDSIARIVTEWRNGQPPRPPEEPDVIKGASSPLAEIQERDYNLSPSRSMTSVTTATRPPNIGQLRRQLEIEYATAREKDAEAMNAIRNLLP